MTRRKKYHFTKFLLLPLGVLTFGLLGIEVNQIFGFIGFVYGIMIFRILYGFKCLSCGKPFSKHYFIVPDNCDVCGKPLDGNKECE
jgi:hypothetical protein